MGICLLHWRLIKFGRPRAPLTEKEARVWSDAETRLERAERDDEIEVSWTFSRTDTATCFYMFEYL